MRTGGGYAPLEYDVGRYGGSDTDQGTAHLEDTGQSSLHTRRCHAANVKPGVVLTLANMSSGMIHASVLLQAMLETRSPDVHGKLSNVALNDACLSDCLLNRQ